MLNLTAMFKLPQLYYVIFDKMLLVLNSAQYFLAFYVIQQFELGISVVLRNIFKFSNY